MNLFIDTNIFLSFYGYTRDDLEELHKLISILEKKIAKLYLTEQVVNEFNRNRENRLKQAIDVLAKNKIEAQFPVICRQYEEFDELKRIQDDFPKLNKSIRTKIINDIERRALLADNLISNIFNITNKLVITDDILSKAKLRHDLGNPPGKNNSLGDAINWEAVLHYVGNAVDNDLYFIADDKDYYSPIDNNKFNSFLSREWKRTIKSELIFYRNISDFFKNHFPEIKLASEIDKKFYTGRLVNSSSFASTHETISKLSQYDEFNQEQLYQMIEAYIYNDQIYRIINDDDVTGFLDKIISMSSNVDNETLDKLNEYRELYNNNYNDDWIPDFDDDDDTIPF